MPKRLALTRRQFIKRSAAIAVAAPTVISAAALGNDAVAAPSERITLGFIGIGKQASGHLAGLTGRSDTQTLAVCDLHALRRQTAKDTVDKINADLERKAAKSCDPYVNFHDLLARKDIDAVVIGTPDHWHTIPIIEACKAKKDIYSEKPLTLTIHEAKTVIEAVRKHDRILQTGSQLRSGCKYHEVRDCIQCGRFGKIREVHVGLLGTSSTPCDLPAEAEDPNVDFDVWLGQAPKRAYNEILCRKPGQPADYPFYPGWRNYREYSGGHITDFGAHELDIVQWTLGMDGSGPGEILPPENENDGYGAKLIYRKTPLGDDIVVTHVRDVFTGPKLVVSKDGKSSQMQTVTEARGLLFIGEDGKIFANPSYAVSDPPDLLKALPGGAALTIAKAAEHHRGNWLECIRTRQKPICDVATGAGSATVCHLLNLAYWHNRKLAWDPQKWEFPGDAEANGWRDRPRREGYQLPEF